MTSKTNNLLIFVIVIFCVINGHDSKRKMCANILIASICNEQDEIVSNSIKQNSDYYVVDQNRQSPPKPKQNDGQDAYRQILGEVVFKPLLTAILNATKSRTSRKKYPNRFYPPPIDPDQPRKPITANYEVINLNSHKPIIIEDEHNFLKPNEIDQCAIGFNQSPINIEVNKLVLNISMYLKLTSFHTPLQNVHLQNTGQTGMLIIN